MTTAAGRPARGAVPSVFPAQPSRMGKFRTVSVGAGITLFVLLLALLGPELAAQDPLALLGPSYGEATPGHPLGFDYLGHDVLSRVLYGGRMLIVMSFAATAIAWTLGVLLGLIAGYSARWVDHAIVWCADGFHAFPNVILILLVVSMLGRERWIIVCVAASAMIPGVIRLARGLTQGVASLEFVEAAAMQGQSHFRIRLVEILPNILTPMLVHFGTMMSWAVAMLSALSFLGYGIAPPLADWGLMMSENHPGLALQPWGVLAPTAMVALLALGTNLLAESLGRLQHGREG